MFYTLNDLSGVQYSDTDCLEIQLYVESQLALIEALMSLVKKKWVRYCGAQCPVLAWTVFQSYIKHATSGRVCVVRSPSLFSIVLCAVCWQVDKGTKIVTLRVLRGPKWRRECHFSWQRRMFVLQRASCCLETRLFDPAKKWLNHFFYFIFFKYTIISISNVSPSMCLLACDFSKELSLFSRIVRCNSRSPESFWPSCTKLFG